MCSLPCPEHLGSQKTNRGCERMKKEKTEIRWATVQHHSLLVMCNTVEELAWPIGRLCERLGGLLEDEAGTLDLLVLIPLISCSLKTHSWTRGSFAILA